MKSSLHYQVHPRHFTRGRMGAWLCGFYLTLVLAAWTFTLYDVYFVDHADASFAGIPLVLLTAPLSFAFSPIVGVFGMLTAADPDSILTPIVTFAPSLALGVIQAYVAWLVLRGRRVVNEPSPPVSRIP